MGVVAHPHWGRALVFWWLLPLLGRALILGVLMPRDRPLMFLEKRGCLTANGGDSLFVEAKGCLPAEGRRRLHLKARGHLLDA